MVAEFFDIEVIHETKRSVQRDSSVRIELTISQELAQKIEQAQALVSHSVPTRDLTSFLEYVSEKIIKQKTDLPRASKGRQTATRTTAVTATSNPSHCPFLSELIVSLEISNLFVNIAAQPGFCKPIIAKQNGLVAGATSAIYKPFAARATVPNTIAKRGEPVPVSARERQDSRAATTGVSRDSGG